MLLAGDDCNPTSPTSLGLNWNPTVHVCPAGRVLAVGASSVPSRHRPVPVNVDAQIAGSAFCRPRFERPPGVTRMSKAEVFVKTMFWTAEPKPTFTDARVSVPGSALRPFVPLPSSVVEPNWTLLDRYTKLPCGAWP